MATATPRTVACAALLLMYAAVSIPHVLAVLPTGRMSLDLLPRAPHNPQFTEQLCSPSGVSGWGVPLPAHHDSRCKHVYALSTSQPGNSQGCTPYTLPAVAAVGNSKVPLGTLVVADRGNCSFVDKALLAQAAGATGVIIRGTKKAVYEAIASRNTTNTTTTLTARDPGQNAVVGALASTEKPVFEYDCTRGEGFVTQLADPVWSTDTPKCSDNPLCESKSCVLTGQTTPHDETQHQVCCMWDTYVLMGAANRTAATKALDIPVVYVTIADGQRLQHAIDNYPSSLVIRTFRRDLPFIDVSSMLLWALGVATALGAAYYSSAPMRRKNGESVSREEQKRRYQDGGQAQDENEGTAEEIWELDARHAVAFIVLAGVFLTVFYYVKIGGVIPVLFCFSGAATLTQLVAVPALEWLMPSVAFREFELPVFGDTVRVSEILGLVPSVAVAVIWYMNRRTYWPLQDLMGIALCFVFLRTVQLPNLKVATVLLTLAFCYDVFFVFLSPAFFGSSVMEDVATGGPAAYTKSDYPGVDYCERYPKYPACEDPEPMPMLLVLPRVLDWAGGVSMLGLGDIILPGMLLSFALRFDYSAASLDSNYFRLMAVGYAVGLGMANLAVTITELGQPALMYLVPTTLGPLLVVSKRRGDFRAMWSGIGMEQIDGSGLGKHRNSDEGGYSTVGTTATSTGIIIGEPIGRSAVNETSRGSDHAPLLTSSPP